MTNLQILLDCLDPEEQIRDKAILDYFEDQEAIEYTVNGVEYLIVDAFGVKDMLEDQYKDEFNEFKRSVRGFDEILDAINFKDTIDTLVDDHGAEDVTSCDFLMEHMGMFIFIL